MAGRYDVSQLFRSPTVADIWRVRTNTVGRANWLKPDDLLQRAGIVFISVAIWDQETWEVSGLRRRRHSGRRLRNAALIPADLMVRELVGMFDRL